MFLAYGGRALFDELAGGKLKPDFATRLSVVCVHIVDFLQSHNWEPLLGDVQVTYSAMIRGLCNVGKAFSDAFAC